MATTEFNWVWLLQNDGQVLIIQPVKAHQPVFGYCLSRGYRNNPCFWNQFGRLESASLAWNRRMVFESLSRRLSSVLNLRYCCAAALYSGARFRREFDIDRFAVRFVGKFEVRAVALGGVGGAGALGFAALHHSLQNRTFAEIFDLLQASSEFQKALRVALQGGISCNGTEAAFRNRNT